MRNYRHYKAYHGTAEEKGDE